MDRGSNFCIRASHRHTCNDYFYSQDSRTIKIGFDLSNDKSINISKSDLIGIDFIDQLLGRLFKVARTYLFERWLCF